MRHIFRYLFEALAIVALVALTLSVIPYGKFDFRYLPLFFICFGVSLCLKYLRHE